MTSPPVTSPVEPQPDEPVSGGSKPADREVDHSSDRSNRWLWPTAIGLLVLAAASLSIDGLVIGLAREWHISGDVRRELLALQQFGQLTMTTLIAWCIWQVDPSRRRVLLDLLLAKAMLAIAVLILKAGIGRPRPHMDDPLGFLGPFGSSPAPAGGAPERAWAWGSGLNADFASMPSGHSAHAVLVAVTLALWYPRLRPVCVLLAAFVGTARVLFTAHYPSDVFAGAALGLILAGWVVTGYRGVRLVDWLWVRLVNRRATPCYPAIRHKAPLGTARATTSSRDGP